MDSLIQDLRFAWRTLRRGRGSTLVALMTLGIAIGLNTSVFSLVNAISFRPLPYFESERLVHLLSVFDRTRASTGVSAPDVADLKAGSKAVTDIAVYQEVSLPVRIDGEPESMQGMRAGANLFGLLGVDPLLGRGLLSSDQEAGAEAAVVISHELWRGRFASDAGIVGRTMRIDGEPHTIVGVMPPSFGFVDFAQFWLPARGPERTDRAARNFASIARLRGDLTMREAVVDVGRVAKQLSAAYPDSNGGWTVSMYSLEDTRSEPFFIAIVIAALLVLLVACANVGNLLLARAAARRHEISVRLMVGASRARLLRQLLTESALLAAGGAALGALFAVWGIDAMVAVLPTDQLPAWLDMSLDYRVVGFAIGATALSVLVFGLAPALTALRTDLSAAAREATYRTSTGLEDSRLRAGLVAGEIALSLMLLTGAGLLVRSAVNLSKADPGYEVKNVLQLSLTLSESRYARMETREAYVAQALERALRVPGAAAAAVTASVPRERVAPSVGNLLAGVVTAAGAPVAEPIQLGYHAVTTGFFQTMGLRTVRGRTFTDADRVGAPLVAVLSRSAAEQLWPRQDPIGRSVKLAGPDETAAWITVVGVMSDRYHIGSGEGGQTRRVMREIFLPAAQGMGRTVEVLVRGQDGDVMRMAGEARRAVQSVDADQPLTDVQALQDDVYSNARVQRWLGGLAATFAVMALILAAIGLFGVIAYMVVQRTPEIGIRMALGAGPGEVVRLVVRGGMRMVVMGVLFGLAGALVVGKLLSVQLFGVSAFDPVTFTGVALTLVGVAALACWLPARRAARIDPLVALQGE